MGFWNIFSRKKDRNKENAEAGVSRTDGKKDSKRSIRLNTQAERIGYIKDNCETIIESFRQTEEAKAEYQAVT